jgi:uncharacterized protein YukE
MGLLGTFEDGVKDVVGGAVKIGEASLMAPAEIAHWAVGEMFGGGDADLHRIAAELTALSRKMDALGKEVSAALAGLTWHGKASDAFVQHSQERVKSLSGVADGLDGLSKAVTGLANAC